ncbi:hypothetical protein [Archangium sp.]|uniref:hypothetical protein n=1 Tax=Archangium sp. TaxID=1872627 RepID=UPI00389A5D58
MKRLLLAVLSLATFLPVPALAAAQKVTLPTKTKNACIRKAARLVSFQKYEGALTELTSAGCTENLGTEEQLWVDTMQGVVYNGLGQGTEAEAAFCRALLAEPLASLPLERPTTALNDLFEKMRVDCPERNKPKPPPEPVVQAPPPPEPVVAEATPPPAESSSDSMFDGSFSLSGMRDSLEVYAGLHGEADLQRLSGPLPLYGANVQGSVHLFHGLRAGVGLTALASTRFSSGPLFLLMADARLSYPILPANDRFGLRVYAMGGPLLYTTSEPAGGARAGLGLALDVSKLRVSLGGAYEWRSNYRLGYSAPMAFMELGWKFAGPGGM